MGRLQGKVALVSGGARGQGEEEVRRFVAEGASVVFGDLLDELGRQVAADVGEQARYVHLDVGEEADWAAAVEVARDAFGGVDVLVNNAGIASAGPLLQLSREEWERVLRVNQTGVLLGMQAVVPAMTERGGGSIVNIASVEGFGGTPGVMAYTATKFAVRGMTKVAALELAPRGIRVNAICPGLVATPMILGDGPVPQELVESMYGDVPIGRPAQPADIAPLAVFLASDESAYMTGSDVIIDGGLTAGVPLPEALKTALMSVLE